MEGHARGFHVPFVEVEILFEFVQDGSAARVDAEVFACELEVGDVGFNLEFEEFASDKVGEEEELLGDRQDEGAESGDVGFERVASDGHEVFRKLHAYISAVVLLLVDTGVRVVVGALVSSHCVQELVFRAPSFASLVRQ